MHTKVQVLYFMRHLNFGYNMQKKISPQLQQRLDNCKTPHEVFEVIINTSYNNVNLMAKAVAQRLKEIDDPVKANQNSLKKSNK
jgi:hypothetical protein